MVGAGCGHGAGVHGGHRVTDDGQTAQGLLADWPHHSGPDEQGLYSLFFVYFGDSVVVM